jgi:phosphoribosylformylglycinamidine synthase
MGFPPVTGDGEQIFLLGETACELSGSEWAWVTHGHLGGRPPKVDLVREQRLGALMSRASQAGHVSAAHDLSDGGLAQVLVESCLRHDVGAQITLPDDGTTSFVYLFSESASRALVAVPRGHDKAFVALAADYGVPCTPLGVTTRDAVLEVRDEFSIPLPELREAWSSTLPRLFGGAAEIAGRHGDPEHAADPSAPSGSDRGDEVLRAAAAGGAMETAAPVEDAVRSLTLEISEPEPADAAPGGPIEPEAVAEASPEEKTDD